MPKSSKKQNKELKIQVDCYQYKTNDMVDVSISIVVEIYVPDLDHTLAKLSTSFGSFDLEKTVKHEIQSYCLDAMHEIPLYSMISRPGYVEQFTKEKAKTLCDVLHIYIHSLRFADIVYPSPLMEKLIELKVEWAKLKEVEKEWSFESVVDAWGLAPNVPISDGN